jgi:hypothetical protein
MISFDSLSVLVLDVRTQEVVSVIFALVDYLRYRFQGGPYSPRKLEEEGWFLADESSLDAIKDARDGDVLFSQPINSFKSWVVMYFQGGPCSHVGMLTNEGTVVEAIGDGVVERPASVYFDGNHYLAVKRLRQSNDEAGHRMVSLARSQIGCKYNWGGVVSLGFHILIGNHWDWRPRISFDAFILLASAWLVAYKFPSVRWFILFVGTAYAATLFMVRLRLHPAPYETTVAGRWPQKPL